MLLKPESHLGLVAFLFNYINTTLHQIPLHILDIIPEDIIKIAKRERGREGGSKKVKVSGNVFNTFKRRLPDFLPLMIGFMTKVPKDTISIS